MRIHAWILSLLSTFVGPAPAERPDAELGDSPSSTRESIEVSDEPAARRSNGHRAPLATRALMPAFDRAIAEYAASRSDDASLETSAALVYWLERLPAWARTYTVCEWAVSDREPLQRALTSPALSALHIVGLRSALEYLTEHAPPEVRERAAAGLAEMDRIRA